MSDKLELNQRGRLKSDISLLLGFIAILLFFIASGFISQNNTVTVRENTDWVVHTHEVLIGLAEAMSYARQAESSERGYILTGDPAYLQPYKEAVSITFERLDKVEKLTRDNPEQNTRVREARKVAQDRVSELERIIQIRSKDGFSAAREKIQETRGRELMSQLRSMVSRMQDEERILRVQRIETMKNSYRTTLISIFMSALFGVVLSIVVTGLLRKGMISRRRQAWLQEGQIGLALAAAGDQTADQLGQSLLKFLTDYVGASAAAFFVKNGKGFYRVATYGVPSDSKMPEKFELQDGLLGQAAHEGKSFFIDNVPENYLTFGSALGQGTPRYLVISPAKFSNISNAVFELGFVKRPSEETIALLEQASDLIGVAIRSAKYRSELQGLLEETQRQAEELQAQSEELRVSNEELEEQSRALKESQTRLEQQQAELEQTNSQLEEQAQKLEMQRDTLARAQVDLQNRSDQLEKASQYKSDFLANMSHELRTPLNSSLILAKLLGDNAHGNLSEEQVKFARTIESSGNDLLTLINDILDLSKIEAGHMEIRPEVVPVEWMFRDLQNIFEEVGKQKSVSFVVSIAPDAPKSIETDRQRLEQILKNLLSNAFKFTDSGSVELSCQAGIGGHIEISVKDTGIGISPENQKLIFDAFRQADGTISRKYGGTGLGLSISRELVRLLDGRIDLQSEQGKGSIFTLYLPAVYIPKAEQFDSGVTSRINYQSVVDPIPEHVLSSVTIPSPRIPDDRNSLDPEKRTILVIEDDETFASILYDLAHEMNFKCLLAGTAEEAMAICKQYIPSAVVLDIGLPDHSGLSVLDRLKRDPKTRHIPVHVVSANDYAQTALSLGAAGYMLKPVKREELEDAFKNLEHKLSSDMRRVLLVEDDDVQRDSVMRLLNTRNVETVAVGTVSECLKKLKNETFDCMILDLSLPDASGYSLLETLSQETSYSFPPVIVYTGRDLNGGDEQKLRRYSQSIIIKGAKSPERLLDEVTLFLHQIVSDLPPEHQKMLEAARHRDAILEGRRILIVEDDIRNVYAVTNIFEPLGAIVQIARNGREALEALEKSRQDPSKSINLVLMDVMMPEMDGMTATREIRKNPQWKKLPIIMLTAKAMRDDQERCMEAGANDYMAKPLDVEKLLSLVRVWMPR